MFERRESGIDVSGEEGEVDMIDVKFEQTKEQRKLSMVYFIVCYKIRGTQRDIYWLKSVHYNSIMYGFSRSRNSPSTQVFYLKTSTTKPYQCINSKVMLL